MAKSRINPGTDAPSEVDGIGLVPVDAPGPSGSRELKGRGVTKWVEGLQVRGMFLALRGITTSYGDSELVDLELSGGKRVTFGAPVVLGQRLRTIEPGHEVTIRCLGKSALPNGGSAWQFKVWTPGADDSDI